MKNISRQTFLQQISGIGAFLSLSAFNANNQAMGADDFYKKVVAANNKEVAKLIQALATDITEIRRRLGFDIANLAAAYCEPTSHYYQNEELVPLMAKIMRFLVKEQQPDGTLDFGNLSSPPDTAFILEPLCAALSILRQNTASSLTETKNLLQEFILKAGEALRLGGVHTPNHRWVISAALARINALFPNKAYIKRIDEWLSEHIFIDADGHYLERSMIYSEVIDRCLITMARLLNRPNLLEPVRKNLSMTYFYLEPNGDLVSIDARRQDQFTTVNALDFYLDYRFVSIHDNNGEFAFITNFIENIKGFEEKTLNDLLFHLLDEPLLKKELPAAKKMPFDFEKFFQTTNLVRIRRNDTTTTIFGGTDYPLIIGSGRSTSPNFFTFRKGDAILKYMRFSTDFFSTGYFRSRGVKHEGNKYILHQKIEAPYYQPLPEKYKKLDGDYKHSQSTDGRFWNKMDFEHRPQSNVKAIETTISIEEKSGSNELIFKTVGTAGVHVTIEFCFKEGGQLKGLKKIDESSENYTLESGFGEYSFGKDTITFGEGLFKHVKLKGLEGEMYTSHFGSLRTEGIHVFLTGITPFEHILKIK